MSQDVLLRFLFDDAPVRGEWLSLDAVWQTVQQRHDYPPELRALVGEWLAAAVLLRATLKFEGSLVVQLQGQGPVSLIVVECAAGLKTRATARWQGDLTGLSLQEMVGNGVCSILLDPCDGSKPYQGVVPIEGAGVAQILEQYMQRSEQLETRLWLVASEQSVGGLLLQKMPEQGGQTAENWSRITQLADTVRPDELLTLAGQTLLYRLFHQENLRLLQEDAISFGCACSREKVENMIRMLGADEADAIVSEQGEIVSRCEFCGASYVFDAVDVSGIFAAAASGSLHRH